MREPLIKLPGKGAHANKMVAETAQKMAEEVYESWASRSDEFYKENQDLKTYVSSCWPLYLDAARATLAQLLTTNIADTLKDQIHDALVRDTTLRRGREGVLQMKKGKGA